MPNYALNDHYESFIRKQLESGRYNNASEEIPARLTELQRDPAKGVPAETVFSRLEARHRAKQAKAK